MENKTEYPVLNRATGSFFAGKVQMIHVKTQNEPYKAFGAPTLEIATFTLKDGESMSALESLIRELVDAVSGGAGVVDATWGPVEEKPNALVLFIGWTSVEVTDLFPSVQCEMLTPTVWLGALGSGEDGREVDRYYWKGQGNGYD